MSAVSWFLMIVIVLWGFAAIGMDPNDYRGTARKAVVVSRAALFAVFLAVLFAYIAGYFLPPVGDGIDPKYPF